MYILERLFIKKKQPSVITTHISRIPYLMTKYNRINKRFLFKPYLRTFNSVSQRGPTPHRGEIQKLPHPQINIKIYKMTYPYWKK